MARVVLEGQPLLPFCFIVGQTAKQTEEPLRNEAMTVLRNEQLAELVGRVHATQGSGLVSRGRPSARGLFASVALVVC